MLRIQENQARKNEELKKKREEENKREEETKRRYFIEKVIFHQQLEFTSNKYVSDWKTNKKILRMLNLTD
jgi:hypothetical protein